MFFFGAWLPETKDLPLEEIVTKFEGKLGQWKEKTDSELKSPGQSPQILNENGVEMAQVKKPPLEQRLDF